MNLEDQIDEILYRSFRWMTAQQIAAAILAMFGVAPDSESLLGRLDAQLSWTRYGDRFAIDKGRRADWLVEKFGLL